MSKTSMSKNNKEYIFKISSEQEKYLRLNEDKIERITYKQIKKEIEICMKLIWNKIWNVENIHNKENYLLKQFVEYLSDCYRIIGLRVNVDIDSIEEKEYVKWYFLRKTIVILKDMKKIKYWDIKEFWWFK